MKTNHTQIATVGWVNSAGNNVVHLDGTETITGSKTFNATTTTISGSNNYALMYLKGKKVLAQTGATHTAQIVIDDVNNKHSGLIQNIRYADGYTTTDIASYNSAGSSSSMLRLYMYDNGTTYAECATPTDTTSTSSTQIATVGWCNNRKQDTITGAATTITSSNLTASRALVSDSSGKVDVSSVTSNELGYVSGVTSAIQTQLDSKVNRSFNNVGTIVESNLTGTRNSTYDLGFTDNKIKIGHFAVYCAAHSHGGSGVTVTSDCFSNDTTSVIYSCASTNNAFGNASYIAIPFITKITVTTLSVSDSQVYFIGWQ